MLILVVFYFPLATCFFTTPGFDSFNFGMSTQGYFENRKVKPTTTKATTVVTTTTTPTTTARKDLCTPVDSHACGKYMFNQTARPFSNYPGHKSVQEAEQALSRMFKEIKMCSGISRERAESIGCAIHIPLCLPSGHLLPPCSEDCEETINGCRIMDISGYEEALGICTIFPSRSSGTCFTNKENF